MNPNAKQLSRVAELVLLTAETVRMFAEGETYVDGQGDRLIEVSRRLEEDASIIALIASEIERKVT